jgi:hypothetical protein
MKHLLSTLGPGTILALMVILHSGCTSEPQRTIFYISPEGNDSNSGLSEDAAWKTIERVNRETFQAGSAILFEAGGVWNGQMRPRGEGKPGKPIIISSYGKGSKPIINMGETEGVGIQLVNQSWWEIDGIEITSGAPPELGIRRVGISATVEGEGQQIEHIVIWNCYIHDIWGQVGGNKSGLAIYVGQLILGHRQSKNCTANDVLVENNTIKRVDKVGIAVNGKQNIIVRGNYMENLGGDGIVVINAHQGLIERNIADRTCLRSGDPDLDTGGEDWWPHTAAIWIWRCTETVMQFNEVYNTGRQPRNGDGQAYDFDFDCERCILQYNYSRNNHGFLLVMWRTKDNIARYNISQNDQTHLIQIQGNTEDGNLIHNNVFYVDHSTVDLDYYCGREGDRDKTKLGATFRNNVFYAGGQGRFRTVYTSGSDGLLNKQYDDTIKLPSPEDGPLFQRNCYFGPWLNGLPNDKSKIVIDPKFVEPGSGGTGLTTLKGYQLQAGSPLVDAGISIEPASARDFYGNLIEDSAIDLGVHEQQMQNP